MYAWSSVCKVTKSCWRGVGLCECVRGWRCRALSAARRRRCARSGWRGRSTTLAARSPRWRRTTPMAVRRTACVCEQAGAGVDSTARLLVHARAALWLPLCLPARLVRAADSHQLLVRARLSVLLLQPGVEHCRFLARARLPSRAHRVWLHWCLSAGRAPCLQVARTVTAHRPA